jgi:CHAD domain-containing protein
VLQTAFRERHGLQRGLVRRLKAVRMTRMLQQLAALGAAPPPRRRARTVAEAGGRLLFRRQRKLRAQARSALASGEVADLHELRLQAKKLRYLAEPLVAVYGAPLRRFLRRLLRVQALLGELHDAEQLAQALSALLEEQGDRLPAATVFAMGQVVARQQGRARELQQRFPAEWRRLKGRCWRRLRRALRASDAGC